MSEENNKESTPVKMEDVKASADERKCPVQRSLTFVKEFLAAPMCGKCFPCSMGSYEAEIRLNKLVGGTADEEDIGTIKKIASIMLTASMCKKGKDTARYLQENIESVDFAGHIAGVCSVNECLEHIKYIILPEKCTLCGDCLDVCKDNAILGEKAKSFLSGYKPFEIAQKRCTKCGECIKVCPAGAIVLLSKKEAEKKETVEV